MDASPTNATTVDFLITFSEAVTGVDASDFSLDTTVTGPTVSIVVDTGDQANYTITVDTGVGSGTIRLDLKSSGTGIQDLAGNLISGGFTSGETYTIEKTPPDNDEFGSATNVASLSYQDTMSTTGATPALSDPVLPAQCNIAGSGKATVWYKYTPSTDDAIAVDTKTADYDTFIAIWEGITVDSLSFVACNDDVGGTKQSALAIQVTDGKTYYIEIGQP